MNQKNNDTLKIGALILLTIVLFLITPQFLQSFIKHTFNIYDIIFLIFIKIVLILATTAALYLRYDAKLEDKITHALIILLLFLGASYLLTYQGNIFSGWFDLDKEEAIPTYISAMLFFSAFLISAIKLYCTKDNLKKIFWGVLSITILFLSFDEIFQLHESIARRLVIEHWYYIGAPIFIAAIALIGYIAYKTKIESALLKKIILGFALIFIGAVIIEHAGTLIEYNGTYYAIEVVLEEILELSGTIILIHTLLSEVLNKNIKLIED